MPYDIEGNEDEKLRRDIKLGNRQTRYYHIHVALLAAGVAVFVLTAAAEWTFLLPLAGALLVASGASALVGGRSLPLYLGTPGLARHLAERRGARPGTGATAVIVGVVVAAFGVVALVGGLTFVLSE